jgi:hypothetical protein
MSNPTKNASPSSSSRMTALPLTPSTSRTNFVSTPQASSDDRSLHPMTKFVEVVKPDRCGAGCQQYRERRYQGGLHLRLRIPPNLCYQLRGAAQACCCRCLVAALQNAEGAQH